MTTLFWLLLGIFVLIIILIVYRVVKDNYYIDAQDNSHQDENLYIVCTTNMLGVRNTTTLLCKNYTEALQKGDVAIFSGYYIDLDEGGSNMGDAFTRALERGAYLIFMMQNTLAWVKEPLPSLRDKVLSIVNKFPNAFYIEKTMEDPRDLRTHIKVCSFFYIGPQGDTPKLLNKAAVYFGSYNPFTPTTAEAGWFVDGPLSNLILRQSMRCTIDWMKFYILQDPLKTANFEMITGLLYQAAGGLTNNIANQANVPLEGATRIPYCYQTSQAMTVWPKWNTTQCLQDFMHCDLPWNAAFSVDPLKNAFTRETMVFPLPSIKYNMGKMPSNQITNGEIQGFYRADHLLLDFIGRAKKHLKIALLFSALADSNWNTGAIGFYDALKDAYKRGVNVELYVGMWFKDYYNDFPYYKKFIDFLKEEELANPSLSVRFNVHFAVSLHYKFYVSERDIYISNNHPQRSFYETLIEGNDMVIYDCPEIRTFYDNVFNAVFAGFSRRDNLTMGPDSQMMTEYTERGGENLPDPLGYISIPEKLISSGCNLVYCGDDSVASPGGCCVPIQALKMDYYRNEFSNICKIQFVPSLPFDPYNPINFFMVMLNVIDNSRMFIILVNQFTQLGMDPNMEYPDTWARTPLRKAINLLYYQALKRALDRGVKIWICSLAPLNPDGSQPNSNFDYVTPTFRKDYPNQIFPVFLGSAQTSGYFLRQFDQGPTGRLQTNYFVHDKIYATDIAAYVGGQNWFHPMDYDAGVVVHRGNTLYDDIVRRAWALSGNAYTPIVSCMQSPYRGTFVDMLSGQSWKGWAFVNVSPQIYSPPQQMITPNGGTITLNVKPTRLVGDGSVSSNWNMGGGYVTGSLDTYMYQLKTSKGDIYITCWTMSPVESYTTPNSTFLVSDELTKALIEACGRPDVNKIKILMNASTFKYSLFEYIDKNSTYCTGMVSGQELAPEQKAAYRQAIEEFYNALKHPKVEVYMYGNKTDTVPKKVSNCGFFHGKIVCDNNTVSVSSANYTPAYYYSASNFGLCTGSDNKNPIAEQAEAFINFVINNKDICTGEYCEKDGQACLQRFIPTSESVSCV